MKKSKASKKVLKKRIINMGSSKITLQIGSKAIDFFPNTIVEVTSEFSIPQGVKLVEI